MQFALVLRRPQGGGYKSRSGGFQTAEGRSRDRPSLTLARRKWAIGCSPTKLVEAARPTSEVEIHQYVSVIDRTGPKLPFEERHHRACIELAGACCFEDLNFLHCSRLLIDY